MKIKLSVKEYLKSPFTYVAIATYIWMLYGLLYYITGLDASAKETAMVFLPLITVFYAFLADKVYLSDEFAGSWMAWFYQLCG